MFSFGKKISTNALFISLTPSVHLSSFLSLFYFQEREILIHGRRDLKSLEENERLSVEKKDRVDWAQAVCQNPSLTIPH